MLDLPQPWLSGGLACTSTPFLCRERMAAPKASIFLHLRESGGAAIADDGEVWAEVDEGGPCEVRERLSMAVLRAWPAATSADVLWIGAHHGVLLMPRKRFPGPKPEGPPGNPRVAFERMCEAAGVDPASIPDRRAR